MAGQIYQVERRFVWMQDIYLVSSLSNKLVERYAAEEVLKFFDDHAKRSRAGLHLGVVAYNIKKR